MFWNKNCYRIKAKLFFSGGGGDGGGDPGLGPEGLGNGMGGMSGSGISGAPGEGSSGGNVSGMATGFGQSGYGSPSEGQPGIFGGGILGGVPGSGATPGSQASLGEQAVNAMAALQGDLGIGALAGQQGLGMSAGQMAGAITGGEAGMGLMGNALDAAIARGDNSLATALASTLSRGDLFGYNKSRMMSKMGLSSSNTDPSLTALNSVMGVIPGTPSPAIAAAMAAGLDTIAGIPFGMHSGNSPEGSGTGYDNTEHKVGIQQISAPSIAGSIANVESPNLNNNSSNFKALIPTLKLNGVPLSEILGGYYG